MKCRSCQAPLSHTLIDLGTAPPSNAYLKEDALKGPELWFPLIVRYCDTCWLVQTEDFTSREALFSEDYAYFSSTSVSWLDHAQRYCLEMTARFGLTATSQVVEIASNDGYLLRNFRDSGIPSLGVEPTEAVAQAARDLGIDTRIMFFGRETALALRDEGKAADLMAANNVLAHVPDINDFVAGFATLLKPTGVATFEFPHLCNMMAQTQFDTIYHEHFSYLSLTAVERVMAANGLEVFDVERIHTHGGSLRVFVQHSKTGPHVASRAVGDLRAEETALGVQSHEYYRGFQTQAETIKRTFLRFCLDAQENGKRVVGYGAAAKGNTLMNFAGVGPDLMEFVVDRSPGKLNKFMPGSRIPILPEVRLKEVKPDYIVILPWNLEPEITAQLAYCRDWGAKFVTVVPTLNVF